MILQDFIQESVIGKLESVLGEVAHDVKFNNVSGNKWELVVSFDLDQASLNDAEKLFLSELLKHL